MRSTTISWPVTVLGCQNLRSYRGEAKKLWDRSSINDGPSYFRLAANEEVRTYTVSFIWTQDQLNQWEAFYETVLGHGMRWFMMPQLVAGRMVEMYCHLIKGYDIRTSDQYFTVSMQMEAFYRGS